MVKGVNKTIIEINNTGNDVFEKVVLYVKPQYSMLNNKELNKEAKVILKSYCFDDDDFDYDYAERKPANKRFLFILSGVMLLIAVTALMLVIF